MTNIAIVGAGNIGKRHAKWANKYGNLVAVADVKISRATLLAKKYKCNAYSSLTNMLVTQSNIDLVAICTPNGLHVAHTITALEFGNNVLCEKPMALTIGGCEQMIHATEVMNKRLFIVKQNRFNPPVQTVKELIDKGKLGKILNVHLTCAWNRNDAYYEESAWRGNINTDGGILYTQFSHFIDLMYYLIGDIDKVQAMANNFMHKETTEFPDTIVTAFQFVNGALGTAYFTTNAYNGNMEGSLTIFGEKGTVKIGGKYLNKLDYQSIEGDILYVPDVIEGCNNYGSYTGSSSRHDLVYQNVIAVLENKDKIMTTALDGLKTIQIIKKIEEACK